MREGGIKKGREKKERKWKSNWREKKIGKKKRKKALCNPVIIYMLNVISSNLWNLFSDITTRDHV